MEKQDALEHGTSAYDLAPPRIYLNVCCNRMQFKVANRKVGGTFGNFGGLEVGVGAAPDQRIT